MSIEMPRRKFLTGLAATVGLIIAAPAIVRASSLMKIVSIKDDAPSVTLFDGRTYWLAADGFYMSDSADSNRFQLLSPRSTFAFV